MFDYPDSDNGVYIMWKRGRDFMLSPFFHAREFECDCGECSDQLISEKLLTKLSDIRFNLGSPIRINSGYRCNAKQEALRKQGYETAVGISQHELGNAADISPLELSKMIQLVDLATKAFKAVGAGKAFLHVDTREDKTRRWSYGS